MAIDGGTTAAARNIISGNDTSGALIQSSSNNTVEGNYIGVDLNGDGVTANGVNPRTFPNNRQNYPALTSVSSAGGSTTIQGTFASAANATFTIQFFSNTTCDSSGYGEGQTFLGQSTVPTDASGNAAINVVLPVTVTPGYSVTATATDSANNTSEFSACRQQPLPTATPTPTATATGTPTSSATSTATATARAFSRLPCLRRSRRGRSCSRSTPATVSPDRQSSWDRLRRPRPCRRAFARPLPSPCAPWGRD